MNCGDGGCAVDMELYGRSCDNDVVVSQMGALARCRSATSAGLEVDLPPMVLPSPPEVDPPP